jgi:TRAP-type mannitol/chloroaromatic compound transport system substrate-binding protein
LIEGACKTLLQQSLADSAGLQAAALAEMTNKYGIRVLDWPDDVLAALKEAWAKVAKEEGDQDYFFRFVLDDLDKFRAKPAAEAPASPVTGSAAPEAAPAQTAQP